MSYWKEKTKSIYGTFLRMRYPALSGGSILMYHSVSDHSSLLCVSPQMFRRQMMYLKQNNFSVISVAEFLNRLSGGEKLHKIVCLTFDDGYRDNYEIVWPVLQEFSYPATFFVITGLLGKNFTTSDGTVLPLMSKQDLQIMNKDPLVTFMSHTDQHCDLSQISAKQGLLDIQKSQAVLAELALDNINILAYPKGRVSPGIKDKLGSVGIDWALGVKSGIVDADFDRYDLRRNYVNRDTDLWLFKAKVSDAINRI